jgi:hypothetical protein
MIFVDQLFDIDATQHKLLSIDAGNSRFRRHAVVAHIRSLPSWLISQWRGWIGRQFLHSFLSPDFPTGTPGFAPRASLFRKKSRPKLSSGVAFRDTQLGSGAG